MDLPKGNGDLLRKLFQSYKRRDNQAFDFFAHQIVENERQKRHNVLADDLERILEGNLQTGIRKLPLGNTVDYRDLPRDRERDHPLVEVHSTNRTSYDMILSEENRCTLDAILHEYRRGDILRTHGLSPRRRLLFCGPPGCGKTLCAHVIAHELELPLLYVRFDSVISSYLGETSANLRKVFDFAGRGDWVILFDEFDAIGKNRDDPSEHGELKRVVNSFLQMLDGFVSDSIIIAATNHERALDTALWRRFDEIVYMGLPERPQVRALLERKLAAVRHDHVDLSRFTRQMVGATYADIERACQDAMKICFLGNRRELTSDDLKVAWERHKRRLEIITSTVTLVEENEGEEN